MSIFDGQRTWKLSRERSQVGFSAFGAIKRQTGVWLVAPGMSFLREHPELASVTMLQPPVAELFQDSGW